MLKLTAVKIFRAVFCALQKVSFSAQNGQSFQACLFPLVLLINISFEVIFFYGFHRLLYTTQFLCAKKHLLYYLKLIGVFVGREPANMLFFSGGRPPNLLFYVPS